ncbi:uncharacterized protein LOC143028726 [Oratosquilla oratoria]|uniref:uncharacterized protein LOC143028726 n=1 Tax=Oratosquilla oratoria TaxID=337810 RepID=UPI003F7661EE
MNPWQEMSDTSHIRISAEQVAGYIATEIQRKRDRDHAKKEAQKTPPRRTYHVLKDRDYVTYNYGAPEEVDQSRTNTLSSILCRARERSDRRRDREEQRKIREYEEGMKKVEEEQRRRKEERERQRRRLEEIAEEQRLRERKKELRREREAWEAFHTKLARRHYEEALLRRYFQHMKILVILRHEAIRRAKHHYATTLMKKALHALRIHQQQEHARKDSLALSFYNLKILQKYWLQWRMDMLQQKEEEAKIVNHHNLGLMRGYFQKWRSFTADEIVQRHSRMAVASSHYKRCLLQKAFHQWKLFLTTRQEREKQDIIGSNLRQTVMSILPDFSPQSSDFDEESEDEILNGSNTMRSISELLNNRQLFNL